ncbi:MAG: tRNA dihydrouridine synthase DusB [Clostridiales bacterium]|jgi:nifR3 family TIM-barrel protein|nr:tRNA dihydrouridine synthase DusB [Clostridiales bacterium]
MKIGNLVILNPIITAPMAGYTNLAFRGLLRQEGAGLVFGEMVSAQALVYANRRTLELLDFRDEPSPRAVQLVGSSPRVLAEAACMAVELGADLIDLNMGCPAPKIVRNREGCYLMTEPDLAGEILRAVTGAVKTPVTVKCRLGWDENCLNFLSFAQLMEASGASAITLHGRTRRQFYSGPANWQAIARLKQVLSVPVIGNGGIFSPEDALAMLDQTGCDGVMLGRGILGNPWLVGDCLRLLAGEQPLGRPQADKIFALALKQLHRQTELNRKYLLLRGEGPDEAELMAVRSLRGHLAHYIKGMPSAAVLRREINHIESIQELEKLLLSPELLRQ